MAAEPPPPRSARMGAVSIMADRDFMAVVVNPCLSHHQLRMAEQWVKKRMQFGQQNSCNIVPEQARPDIALKGWLGGQSAIQAVPSRLLLCCAKRLE
jgi:hypothetical protein